MILSSYLPLGKDEGKGDVYTTHGPLSNTDHLLFLALSSLFYHSYHSTRWIVYYVTYRYTSRTSPSTQAKVSEEHCGRGIGGSIETSEGRLRIRFPFLFPSYRGLRLSTQVLLTFCLIYPLSLPFFIPFTDFSLLRHLLSLRIENTS